MFREDLPLKPADMAAVVERTHLRPNLDNFLLPVFECISNSLHSINDKSKVEENFNGHIYIEINRNPGSILIKDNGLGLNEENLEAFRTPFTGKKLRKGGKGFGRFISFKVFDEALYSSKHKNIQGEEIISFRFDIYANREISFIDTFTTFLGGTGCSVSLSGVKSEFKNYIESADDDEIVDRIIRYFLPFFISGRMPKLEITIDGIAHEPAVRFKEIFRSDNIINEKIEIGGEHHDFQIGISMSKRGTLFPRHALLLFADDRVIGNPRSIEGKIGTSYFTGSDDIKRVVTASVSGEFLNNRANTARTDIEASEDEIDIIANRISDLVLDQQKEYKEERRRKQQKDLTNVFSRNPLLRTAVKEENLQKYVESKPMSWGAENFVSDLALRRYRDQGRWERELEEKTKNLEALKNARDEILSHIEKENKEALASYVAHRRTVIDLSEKIIGVKDDGETSLEDVFHDIIYPRYSDSENTKFYQHNLWMLDERLAFVTYISSDRTIHGGRRQAGDKVADLIMFEECAVYSNSDANSLVLIEFKRPGRNNYRFGDPKNDPIQQVFETINKIRVDESLINSKGARVEVPKGTRIYSYIIADIEPTLKTVILDHDFDPTWDQQGYYRYHDKRDAFVEILGFNKLVSDAKKRNSAFFEVLLGDLV